MLDFQSFPLSKAVAAFEKEVSEYDFVRQQVFLKHNELFCTQKFRTFTSKNPRRPQMGWWEKRGSKAQE